MPQSVTCRPVDLRSDAVAELASLFELYRIHYGQSPDPAATRAWVGDMARKASAVTIVAGRDSASNDLLPANRCPII